MIQLSMRRTCLSTIQSKKAFSSILAPRNFSSAVLKREHNFNKIRVSVLQKNSRQFSISIAKFQDNVDLTTAQTIAAETIPTPGAATSESCKEIVIDIIPEKPTGVEDTIVLTSTEPTSEPSNEIILDFLPEKPTPVDSSIPETIQYVGDPPFDMLGLNSLWPPGRAQWLMEHIHNDLDIPWWGTILVMALLIRIITLKFVIMSQKNTARMTNNMPETQAIQNKLTDAKHRGDLYDQARYSMELQKLMKDPEKGVSPLASIAPLMVQMPFFIGMFMGLRGMANLPVESMTTGGFGWFTDLTIADPYYILPTIMAGSLFLQFKLSVDGMGSNMSPLMKKAIFYGVPPFMFFMMKGFPAGITFYWSVTNTIAICQSTLLRTPKVRKFVGIPEIKKYNLDQLPGEKKGAWETLKDSYENYKINAAMVDRRAYDEEQFKQAGIAPVKRTYRFDPTKRGNK